MARRSLPPFEDDFARALLRSAEHDEPTQAAYSKAAAALGVGVSIGVGASLPVVAAGAAASAGRWGSPLVAKVVAVAVSGVVLVGAGALLLKSRATNGGSPMASTPAAHALALSSPSTGAPPAPASPPGPNAANARAANAPAPAEPGAAEQAASSEPGAPLVAAAPAEPPTPAAAKSLVPARRSVSKAPRAGSAGGNARSSRASDSSLGEQVRSLDRARVALASGDANGALAELLHYRRSYPHGVFLTEASVLEVEAIAARGDRSLAAVRASEFVAAHPDSPQAERLRALIPKKKP